MIMETIPTHTHTHTYMLYTNYKIRPVDLTPSPSTKKVTPVHNEHYSDFNIKKAFSQKHMHLGFDILFKLFL